MWPIDRPPQWVGRGTELATLRAGVEALRRDEGAVVWVEGEPGIGKSSLVVEALAGVSELGWDIGWGFADQLTERMPLAEELCAAAPTVLVIDDLQWADDASLLVWHQLAASIDQLRLLLIATCRSDPRRQEVQQVRASLARRGGALVTLGPLPETDVADLVTAMLGAPPGDTLRQLTAQADGNPLYLRELVDALARERAQASLAGAVAAVREQLPAS